eukprot:6213032-Pleurochrysis_carterae.AAC.1
MRDRAEKREGQLGSRQCVRKQRVVRAVAHAFLRAKACACADGRARVCNARAGQRRGPLRARLRERACLRCVGIGVCVGVDVGVCVRARRRAFVCGARARGRGRWYGRGRGHESGRGRERGLVRVRARALAWPVQLEHIRIEKVDHRAAVEKGFLHEQA